MHLIGVIAGSCWITLLILTTLISCVLCSLDLTVLYPLSICCRSFSLSAHTCLSWWFGALCLCFPGAADEASVVFGETAARSIQKHYLHHGSASQSLHVSNEDRNFAPARSFNLEDASPRQSKHVQANNTRDIPGNHHNNTLMGGASTQSLTGSSSNISFYNTPSPMATQVRNL